MNWVMKIKGYRMMRSNKIIAVSCAMILAFAGCGAKEETPASDAKKSSVISSSAANDEEGSTTVSSVASNEESAEPKKIKLTIEGYDKDNFPRLDGSLANFD